MLLLLVNIYLQTLYIIVIGLLTEYATVYMTSGDIVYLTNEDNITVWPGK